MALFFIALALAAGLFGGVWGNGAQGRAWYESLRQPPGMPRGARLAAIWLIVYLCLGLAGGALWFAQLPGRWSWSFRLYALALVLLPLWQGVLYGARRLALGWALATALWLAVFAAAVAAVSLSWAAWDFLALPAIWLGWAARHNYYLWKINARARRYDQ